MKLIQASPISMRLLQNVRHCCLMIVITVESNILIVHLNRNLGSTNSVNP